MADQNYKDLREALAAGPTPGPWTVRYDYVVQATSFDGGRLVPVAQPYGVNSDGTDLFANARMIAAANPETIRALLAERDALAAEIQEQARLLGGGAERELRLLAERDALRNALEAIVDGDAEAIAEAEAAGIPFPEEMLTAYRAAVAAMAQHQGEKHGDQ